MKRALYVWLLGSLACGGPEPPTEEEPLDDEALEELEDRPRPELPPMPAPPPPRAGYLTAIAAGPVAIRGEWEASAASCDDPALLQVLSEIRGTGTIMVLVLGDERRVGQYPIMPARDGLPPAPAAQMGAQVIDGGELFAFQAEEGEVEVYELGTSVSGRFAVTLREIRSRDRVQYAGVFDSLPIEPLDDAYCARLQAAADSVPAAVR